MIKPLIWEHPTGQEEAYTLFLPGPGKRSIRLTLHSESFEYLDTKEQEALELLREFGVLDEIDLVETVATHPHYILIPPFNPEPERLEVPYRTRDHEGVAFLNFINQLPEIVASFLKIEELNDSRIIKYIPELMLAQTHVQLRRDILVTGSSFLIKNSNASFLRRVNIRTPLETIKVIGLLLRSRGNYVYHAKDKLILGVDRGGFYWVLMRHKLSELWRYFSACVYSEDTRRDGVVGLGGSILSRAERALRARDAIGIQYYLPPGGETIDEMSYHFDFLLLVLSGALDAMARIAHKAYRIQKPSEYFINFREKSRRGREFIEALRRAGANRLVEYLEEPHFQGVIDLLYGLRNTIHGENLQTLAVLDGHKPGRSRILIPRTSQDEIMNALSRCGSADDWGMEETFGLTFEPFTWASKLIDECFYLINGVAKLTEVEKLFPDQASIPELLVTPPDRDGFDEETRRRLDLLG